MRRELAGYFLSFTGYVIISATAFLLGLSFVVLIENFQLEPTPAPVTELFYNTQLFWLVLLLLVPIITMRLFALEKFTGTFETLMTTPVGDFEVVAAKFSAAMIFYLVIWAPLIAYMYVVSHYTTGSAGLDPAILSSTCLGIFLVGCVYVSLGCFASALTRSQVTASMFSLALGVSLFLLYFLADRVPSANWWSQTLSLFSLPDHMHDFARGVVDTRVIVLYVSLTFFFLFLTLRVIESRRWK
jgi:ABC-2 type transport system permease protein